MMLIVETYPNNLRSRPQEKPPTGSEGLSIALVGPAPSLFPHLHCEVIENLSLESTFVLTFRRVHELGFQLH
jgi:hypothetical protein